MYRQLEHDVAVRRRAARKLRSRTCAISPRMNTRSSSSAARRSNGNCSLHLVPKDPDDDANLFLEVRAGTGGDEAAIFAGDLFRMYSRYAERQGWSVEILSANPGEHGGYREVISRVAGKGAYSKLKFESGVHRVQRVPDTEAQGRIHTSTCTVAVFPEPEDVGEIEINKADLKVDTYRASGAGGQHVNKTDSAIRITHLPTGIVVECQDERSQHKNRARAMSLLSARLRDAEETKRHTETAEKRRSLVGTGDRSERIRTYNFPQGRLTDHRINLTLYKVEDIVNGDLDDVIGPLANEYQADLLGSWVSRAEAMSTRRVVRRRRDAGAVRAHGALLAAAARMCSRPRCRRIAAARCRCCCCARDRHAALLVACVPRARARAACERLRSSRQLVARRVRGEPRRVHRPASASSSRCRCACRPDVLIPRPETELLVEAALARCNRGRAPGRARRRHGQRSHRAGRQAHAPRRTRHGTSDVSPAALESGARERRLALGSHGPAFVGSHRAGSTRSPPSAST